MSDPAQGSAAEGAPSPPIAMGPAARAVDRAIGWYQSARAGRASPCRYLPSCSEYAREAISLRGAVRGSWLGLRRVARCRPFGGHGWDPVPGSGEN